MSLQGKVSSWVPRLPHSEELVRSARAALDAGRLAAKGGSDDGVRGEVDVRVRRSGHRKAMRAGAGSGRA